MTAGSGHLLFFFAGQTRSPPSAILIPERKEFRKKRERKKRKQKKKKFAVNSGEKKMYDEFKKQRMILMKISILPITAMEFDTH